MVVTDRDQIFARGAVKGTNIDSKLLSSPPPQEAYSTALNANIVSRRLANETLLFANLGFPNKTGPRWESLLEPWEVAAAWRRKRSHHGPSIMKAMARGWESKSVEAQQADASEKPAKPRPKLSPAEADKVRQKEGLRLSRQRIMQQLEASQNPRHRKILEDTLADLDQKLSQA